jgi:hypothetical protein
MKGRGQHGRYLRYDNRQQSPHLLKNRKVAGARHALADRLDELEAKVAQVVVPSSRDD